MKTLLHTLRTRIIWLLIPLGMQLLYFPLNRYSTGGIAPSIPLDAYIPVWPVWVVPYVLTLPWWIGFFLWAAFSMDESLYRPFVIAESLAILCGITTFALFPTYVIRPNVTGTGLTWDWLKMLYASDNVYNALPSGHAYVTTIIVIFWWRWKPKLRWLWLSVEAIVLLSTLFTHQHFLLDLGAGVVLAFGVVLLVHWLRSAERVKNQKFPLASNKLS